MVTITKLECRKPIPFGLGNVVHVFASSEPHGRPVLLYRTWDDIALVGAGFVQRNSAISRTLSYGGSKDAGMLPASFEPPCACVRKIAELRRTKPVPAAGLDFADRTCRNMLFACFPPQRDSKPATRRRRKLATWDRGHIASAGRY